MSGNSFADSQRYNDLFSKQVYNVNTSHPLIPSSQEYIFYKKYVSIHSEDRDVLKYPKSSEFEIELPEDYLNVVSMKLVQWTFPANYETFSGLSGNILLAFRISNPYNPGEFNVTDDYNYRIFEALYNSEPTYTFIIEEGFYNPIQMSTELTNKFNHVVTLRITEYFEKQIIAYPNDGWDITLSEFISNGGYTRFIVVYNSVSLKLWFGNRADSFVMLNEVGAVSAIFSNTICSNARQSLPDFSSYGLPAYLGLARCNQESISGFSLLDIANSSKVNGKTVPRFYYGDVTPGDNGYWLLPLDLSGCEVHWVEALWKLNIMGEPYVYMEIQGQNCLDETKPYNVSKFTLENNQTNGVVDSAFAKMAVPTTPLSQWFDRDSLPYKFYNPPAERIRKLKFKIRYHNGQLANFGVFNFSFLLEFTLQVPQILRSSTSVVLPPPSGR
jgi:hypothetical protein